MAGRSPVEAVAQDGMVGSTYPTDELSHPEYVNDDFRMFTFKVMKCPKRYVHDWRSCPFAHPTENARRRDPREVRYMPVPCPDYKRGLCLMGDSCTYSHGVYECWLHPAKYRTQLCKDGAQCRRPVCFFAHSVSELRSPTYTWDSSEGAMANGKQASLGLQDGALPQGAHGHGGHNQGHPQDPGHMNYPDPGHDHNGSQAFHYQQQERPMQDHLDPSQASMGYPYPPAQHHVPYMDPYYAPHPTPNPGMDGYGLGMHMISNPQMPNPNHGGFNSPFPAPGAPRMYPQPPRHAMDAPGMAGMPHVTPYQREQQRLHSMHRYHSQQLSEQQQQQQQQQQQHQVHRQPSGPAPAGSLPSTGAASARSGTPSGAPSAELGDLLNAGGGPGTTAPRMSNAMARSLGLVPPKETRTRTLGALAGLMQGPRATSLTDGVNRPQMSYSLPAQLPDPDQHMHEVYMAAQAAAAGNTTQGTLSQSTQRQASMVLPPSSMGSGGTLSSGLSQTVRQASLGLPQGPGTIGPVTRQQSLGLPQSQGSLGLAPSASLGTAQRQGSLGLPFEPSPQDLQAWQRGLQQGIKGAQASQQKGSGQLDGGPGLAQTAQGRRLVMEQLQGLGVLADGGGNLNSGQLQGLVTMLSKQGVPQKYGHTISSLAGQTIPEAEQVAGVSMDDHALATLLNSFQQMGVTSTQPKTAQTEQTSQGGAGQVYVASPFASPDHAPSLDFLEGGDPTAVGGYRSGSNQLGQLPSRAASLDSSSQSGLRPPQVTSANQASPFASPIQQLHKVSSNSSAGSVLGRSPSGRTSQTTSRQASSSPLPSPHTSAVS